MEKFIQYIKKNKIVSIFTAIVLSLFVLLSSKYLSSIVKPYFGTYFHLDFYTENAIGKLFMLILSIVIILIVNNGTLKDYGFTRAKNFKYSKMIFVTIGVYIASFVIGNILFNGILRQVFPVGTPKGFPRPSSLLKMILTVWIWSSICEEILVRGLLQGFLSHLKDYKFLKLSVPVIISGLFFGAMHLGLLLLDFDIWFVSFIVFNAIVVGLLAAYYREKSESLIPPILIHVLANFLGSIPLIIVTLLDIKIPGS